MLEFVSYEWSWNQGNFCPLVLNYLAVVKLFLEVWEEQTVSVVNSSFYIHKLTVLYLYIWPNKIQRDIFDFATWQQQHTESTLRYVDYKFLSGGELTLPRDSWRVIFLMAQSHIKTAIIVYYTAVCQTVFNLISATSKYSIKK